MHSHIKPTRSSFRQWRLRRGRSIAVRYILLAPPSRLTPEEAAVLLRVPRRPSVPIRSGSPGLGDSTGQPTFGLRA